MKKSFTDNHEITKLKKHKRRLGTIIIPLVCILFALLSQKEREGIACSGRIFISTWVAHGRKP